MSSVESRFSEVLSRRHGVITSTELELIGVTESALRTLVASGRLRRAWRGVFVAASAPDTFEQRMALACAITGGVICFPTAGKVWMFRGTPRCDDIHVRVPWERRVTAPPGVVVHRTRHLPACDIVRRPDGIAITSPPRTVFDAAATVLPEKLESMIEQGIDRGNFIVPTLSDLARRLRQCGRDGSGQFALVLHGREAWRKAVASSDEFKLERAMRRRGFPPLARGHRIELSNGDVIHPDLGIPEHRFFVEVDHRTWHDGRYDSAYDKRRDTKARLSGYNIERVSDLAITNALAETVEDLWFRWHQVRGVEPPPRAGGAPQSR